MLCQKAVVSRSMRSLGGELETSNRVAGVRMRECSHLSVLTARDQPSCSASMMSSVPLSTWPDGSSPHHHRNQHTDWGAPPCPFHQVKEHKHSVGSALLPLPPSQSASPPRDSSSVAPGHPLGQPHSSRGPAAPQTHCVDARFPWRAGKNPSPPPPGCPCIYNQLRCAQPAARACLHGKCLPIVEFLGEGAGSGSEHQCRSPRSPQEGLDQGHQRVV